MNWLTAVRTARPSLLQRPALGIGTGTVTCGHLLGEQLQRLRTQIFEESTLVFGPSSQFESAHVREDEAGNQYIYRGGGAT